MGDEIFNSYEVNVIDSSSMRIDEQVNEFFLKFEDQDGNRVPCQDLELTFKHNGETFLIKV